MYVLRRSRNMGGIHAALLDKTTQVVVQPLPDLSRAPTLNFCRLNPNFTRDYLRTSGTQFATSLPGQFKAWIPTECTSLFRLAVTTRVDALRTVAWDLVHLFPTLVLGQHRLRAPSSAVKVETVARLDLLHCGDLQKLANRAVAANNNSKKATKAMRTASLLRHNKFARVAGVFDGKGVADATP